MKNKTIKTTLSTILALLIMAMSAFSQNDGLTPNAVASFSTFSAPQNMGATPNSADNDQAPVAAPNGLSLYFGSNCPGGQGGNDIWVSQRPTLTSAWGAPQNLGATVNSISSDVASSFSLDGRTMFLQSQRLVGMGSNDIYISTRTDPNNDFGWTTPVNIGAVINTTAGEIGAAYFEDLTTGVNTLFFASDRNQNPNDFYLFQSTRNADGTFNPPSLVNELNSVESAQLRPSIRRDGLEIFFGSIRPGGLTFLVFDIWVSTRASTTSPWNPPVLVSGINSLEEDRVPALSPDGSILYFDSTRAGGFGGFDLYSATRSSVNNFCVPTTTVTEGNLFPGGIVSFGITNGQNSVTVDHVNAGTGLQSLTVVGMPVNATVNIPAFAPGTFNPVTVTFTPTMPGQMVDFTLRAASTFHAANIRVRCAETCTPTTTVSEGDLAPGGIVSFGVMSGAGSVTVDHVNAGTGLQSLTFVGMPTNAVVNIPVFADGTISPTIVTFSVIDPTQPVDFTLRAASTFHAANIRVRCAVTPPNQPEK